MLRKLSTAAGTNVVIVLVSLSVIHAAAPQDSRVQDPPHSSVHHGLAACSASHHAVCVMHSTVNHKMHTPDQRHDVTALWTSPHHGYQLF